MIKVVVIGTRGFPDVQGGVEKHCQQIYPLLAQMGVNVTILTRRPYINEALKSYKGVSLVAIDCPKQKYLEAIVHSFKALIYAIKLKPDIIHVHAVGPALITPFARLLGFKVVFTHHGPDYERKKWNKIAKLILKIGDAFGCLFANKIITIAQNIAESISRKFKKTATIIPNGVVITNVLSPGEAIKGFGLQPQKYILTVGRFVPEKGFNDLILAYRKSGTDGIKLVIVGGADHEDEYSRKIKDSVKGDPNIILTGFLTGTTLEELYSNAGFFVLPSYYEGLPITLLEAMSYGLRCLASDIPANRCVRLNDNNYFRAGDIANLSAKIKQLIDNPLSDKESKEQVDKLRRDYDWNIIAQKTLKIYEELI